MAEELNVLIKHPDYTKRSSQWEIMRDIIEGGDRIKEKGAKYLPPFSSSHDHLDNYEMRRYESYKARADFTNYTAQILDCLHGMVENRPAKVDCPKELYAKGIIGNIDYQGNSADQFWSDCLYDVLITGFGGILADFPKVSPDISVAQAERMNIRPYLTYYRAESIINWRYMSVNGIKKLVLVVLEENVDENDNIFAHELKKRYRVLRFDAEGHCIQEVYSIAEDDKKNRKEILISSDRITAGGEPVDYIPFIMLPYNSPVKPLLYDIALINIGHYQKSADYVNGVHLTTIPTGWTTGHTSIDEKGKPKEDIVLGGDTFIQLPEPDAKIGNLSFSGEGLVHCEQALQRAENQIITLGSHIISAEKNTAENKDAISIHRQGEDAKLATYARYMSKKFTDALKILCRWTGLDDSEVNVELNTDFSSLAFDANAINSIANIFSQGKLPLRSLYYMLMQSGYLEPDMTYDGFVYLLDLEATELSPVEVEEAYRQYRRDGKKVKYEKKDWYSPQMLYEKTTGSDPENKTV